MNYPMWLPFIGFKTLALDNDGKPTEHESIAWWESDCFMVEWFGHGIVLFTTEVRQRKGRR